MIHLDLRGTKADLPWSIKPALKSGLDIAPNPKLSPRFGKSTRSRLFQLSMSSGAGRKETRMETILARCAGLDVHKESVEACVRRIEPNGRVHRETRHWGTMTRDLLEMADWLAAEGVTNVAMESTGVFWKPIFNILEGRFTVLLVNARHLKQVPGRKSDVRDCQWIAQLLQCGLLKGSFIPSRTQRELRDLTRNRTQLVEESSSLPAENAVERTSSAGGAARRAGRQNRGTPSPFRGGDRAPGRHSRCRSLRRRGPAGRSRSRLKTVSKRRAFIFLGGDVSGQ
jgi:Transposase